MYTNQCTEIISVDAFSCSHIEIGQCKYSCTVRKLQLLENYNKNFDILSKGSVSGS